MCRLLSFAKVYSDVKTMPVHAKACVAAIAATIAYIAILTVLVTGRLATESAYSRTMITYATDIRAAIKSTALAKGSPILGSLIARLIVGGWER